MRRFAPVSAERGRLSRFLVIALGLLGLVAAPAAAGAAPAAAGAGLVIRTGPSGPAGNPGPGGAVRGRSSASITAVRHVRQCLLDGAAHACPRAGDTAAGARDLGGSLSGAPLAAVLPGSPRAATSSHAIARASERTARVPSAGRVVVRGRAPPSSTTTQPT